MDETEKTEEETTLDTLPPGGTACVVGVTAAGGTRRRLLDIGLTAGSPVVCLGESPLGDPVAYRVRGAVFALRRTDAQKVRVRRQS